MEPLTPLSTGEIGRFSFKERIYIFLGAGPVAGNGGTKIRAG